MPKSKTSAANETATRSRVRPSLPAAVASKPSREVPASETRVSPADLVLPAILDMRQARPLMQSLTALLEKPAVTVDASAVVRASTGCVQVLVAFARARAAAGAPFALAEPSEAMMRAFADLGLEAPAKSHEVARCAS